MKTSFNCMTPSYVAVHPNIPPTVSICKHVEETISGDTQFASGMNSAENQQFITL